MSWWVFLIVFFFFQAEDGIRDLTVTGVQTCALPISSSTAGHAGATCWFMSMSFRGPSANSHASPAAISTTMKTRMVIKTLRKPPIRSSPLSLSMQLQPRPDHMIDVPDHDHRQPAQPTMNGQNVHLVERHIDEPRDPSLDRQPPADQRAHQAADGGIGAERHQRAVVVIDERLQWLAGHCALEIMKHRLGHLMRRLRA